MVSPGASFDVVRGIIGADLESTSCVELPDVGAWAYSRHESTRVYVLSWCYAEGTWNEATGQWVNVRLGSVRRWSPGQPVPKLLSEFVAAGGRLLAHNASFEGAIWSNILAPLHGFPAFGPAQWCDSQSSGLELNLPAKLEGLAEALGSPVKKDNVGHRLMLKMSRLDANGECAHDIPENRERLGAYCDDDVSAMLHAWFRMPPLSTLEERARRLDQKINARGVYLDRELAGKLQRLALKRTERLERAACRLTGFEVANAVEPRALKAWLRARGVALPMATRKKKDGTFHKTESTAKGALAEILARPGLDPLVRQVLDLRAEATKATSLAKLARVETMVGGDGRLRNALKFHAASTGRWSSTGLQIHNLPKDRLSPASSALVSMLVDREDLDGLELVERSPLAAMSQKLRSVISAAPGCDLIAADYSAIEARVLAWLAGQADAVGFFHVYDRELAEWRAAGSPKGGKPVDYYEFTAAGIGSDDRQLGKVAALALGYGMGAVKFHGTAADWGVPISLKLARQVQKAWRATNVMVVAFWKELENAFRAVVQDRTQSVVVGRLRVYGTPHCVFIRLPSGRSIRYWRPSLRYAKKMVKVVDDEGAIVEREFETMEIAFWTPNPAKNGLTIETTYSGKLVENVTQGVSRDILSEGLLRLDSTGYPLVMHVHDSAAGEVPEGTGDVDEFCALMAALPAWADGCPVAAEGYRAKRFRG